MSTPKGHDPLAERVLSLLTGQPEAGQIVLGGYFVLHQHVPYRTTHDIDAWWKGRADPAAERAIRNAMQQVSTEQGTELRERRFGETISFELLEAGQVRFSFQIALRSISLEDPQPSAWPPILTETLSDNLASKMNALVDRGAPRDLVDVWTAVDAGLVNVARCWALWQAKNPGGSIEAAKQNVLLHLAGLEARRPLAAMDDPQGRDRARRVRQWIREELASR